MIATAIAPGGFWLEPAAAGSYARARAAGMPAGVTSAGRTYAEQADLYADYLAGRLPATAARPGTSVHEQGRALDLPAWPRAWLVAHPQYGWTRPLLPSEPWHFEYDPARDTSATTPTEDDEMRVIKYGRSTYYVVQGDTIAPATQADYDRAVDKGLDLVLDNLTLEGLRAAMTRPVVDVDALADAIAKQVTGLDSTAVGRAIGAELVAALTR